ncbi:methyltransferase [Diplodia corticola]|uniref:Methyltransferase n=1 Tax=Diplodia corticola TaxID=236234 RepID=A0A1J9RRX5_9PEZI|nr:methyltransferase [Diplodia corticola]OJD30644.1 methyltransferase [Diplodia corticola]
MDVDGAAVQTYTHFLQRDALYAKEKPYSLRYTPPEGFPRANIKLERHNLTVRDVRPVKDELLFERDGCQIIDFNSRMKYDDWDDDANIKAVYLLEVADRLRSALGACHVQIFEHTVRKRHEIFPISTGEPYKYNQPTSIAHIDTTVPWVLDMVRSLNPKKAEDILKHRIQCVNVWKPIVGPVRDWPLAMCESRTMNVDRDLEPCDLVYPDYVVENRQVYFSEAFEWIYLSDQQPNEAWVFLQSDTDPSGKPVAHTAFPIPSQSEKAGPRESIEARALVYYGGF